MVERASDFDVGGRTTAGRLHAIEAGVSMIARLDWSGSASVPPGPSAAEERAGAGALDLDGQVPGQGADTPS